MARLPNRVRLKGEKADRLIAAIQDQQKVYEAARLATEAAFRAQNTLFDLAAELSDIPREKQYGIDRTRVEQGIVDIVEPHCIDCGVVHTQEEFLQIHPPKINAFMLDLSGDAPTVERVDIPQDNKVIKH